MATSDKTVSYDGVPTSEPEIMVAVASPATVESKKQTDPFFVDCEDIVAVFEYNFDGLRKNQLQECGFVTGMLCFISSFAVLFMVDEHPGAALYILLGLFAFSLLCCFGFFRTFFDITTDPSPETHTCVTTSGILHAIEPNSSGIGGGECQCH